jgi:hypothetical protein
LRCVKSPSFREETAGQEIEHVKGTKTSYQVEESVRDLDGLQSLNSGSDDEFHEVSEKLEAAMRKYSLDVSGPGYANNSNSIRSTLIEIATVDNESIPIFEE